MAQSKDHYHHRYQKSNPNQKGWNEDVKKGVGIIIQLSSEDGIIALDDGMGPKIYFKKKSFTPPVAHSLEGVVKPGDKVFCKFAKANKSRTSLDWSAIEVRKFTDQEILNSRKALFDKTLGNVIKNIVVAHGMVILPKLHEVVERECVNQGLEIPFYALKMKNLQHIIAKDADLIIDVNNMVKIRERSNRNRTNRGPDNRSSMGHSTKPLPDQREPLRRGSLDDSDNVKPLFCRGEIIKVNGNAYGLIKKLGKSGEIAYFSSNGVENKGETPLNEMFDIGDIVTYGSLPGKENTTFKWRAINVKKDLMNQVTREAGKKIRNRRIRKEKKIAEVEPEPIKPKQLKNIYGTVFCFDGTSGFGMLSFKSKTSEKSEFVMFTKDVVKHVPGQNPADFLIKDSMIYFDAIPNTEEHGNQVPWLATRVTPENAKKMAQQIPNLIYLDLINLAAGDSVLVPDILTPKSAQEQPFSSTFSNAGESTNSKEDAANTLANYMSEGVKDKVQSFLNSMQLPEKSSILSSPPSSADFQSDDDEASVSSEALVDQSEIDNMIAKFEKDIGNDVSLLDEDFELISKENVNIETTSGPSPVSSPEKSATIFQDLEDMVKKKYYSSGVTPNGSLNGANNSVTDKDGKWKPGEEGPNRYLSSNRFILTESEVKKMDRTELAQIYKQLYSSIQMVYYELHKEPLANFEFPSND